MIDIIDFKEHFRNLIPQPMSHRKYVNSKYITIKRRKIQVTVKNIILPLPLLRMLFLLLTIEISLQTSQNTIYLHIFRLLLTINTIEWSNHNITLSCSNHTSTKRTFSFGFGSILTTWADSGKTQISVYACATE